MIHSKERLFDKQERTGQNIGVSADLPRSLSLQLLFYLFCAFDSPTVNN
ncbi:hypothetical protein HSIEG1_2075 [Enterococcus sp. HSIEG1]|nr:hypothetical protein HSIEG1_2075 [Enterococcus sp. HSIEG1]